MRWQIVLVLGLACLAALAVGFVVGRGMAPDGAASVVTGAEDDSLRRTNEDLRRQLAEVRSMPSPARGNPEDATSTDPARAPDPADGVRTTTDLAGGDEAVAMNGAFPSVEGVQSAGELSALFMRFVDQQLARGPDGYRTLLRALAAVPENGKTLERFFQDEASAMREMYPWVKFLVAREDRVLDLTEYTFKTMAEEPGFFEGMDDDPLEVFTQGVAAMMPGAVSPERLERFRGYARTILAMPKESLPKAISGNFNEIQRALDRYWTMPISTEDALTKLQTGELDATQALRLLRTLKPSQLEGIDVTALLVPLVEAGNYDGIRALGSLQTVPIDHTRLDAAAFRGLESGSLRSWFVPQYLAATQRSEWVKARPFFDQAFAGTEATRNAAAEALLRLGGTSRPDKAYVADLLQRYQLPEQMRASLTGRYDLK